MSAAADGFLGGKLATVLGGKSADADEGDHPLGTAISLVGDQAQHGACREDKPGLERAREVARHGEANAAGAVPGVTGELVPRAARAAAAAR